MKGKHISDQHHDTFEGIHQFDAEGNIYWNARDLQPLLEYAAWDKFKRVIEKSMQARQQSGYVVEDHFADSKTKCNFYRI